MSKITYPTEAELAVTQAAIGDAYDAWVKRVEPSIDWPGHVDRVGVPEVSEAPAFSELVAADAEQLDELSADVREAIRRAAPGR